MSLVDLLGGGSDDHALTSAALDHSAMSEQEITAVIQKLMGPIGKPVLDALVASYQPATNQFEKALWLKFKSIFASLFVACGVESTAFLEVKQTTKLETQLLNALSYGLNDAGLTDQHTTAHGFFQHTDKQVGLHTVAAGVVELLQQIFDAANADQHETVLSETMISIRALAGKLDKLVPKTIEGGLGTVLHDWLTSTAANRAAAVNPQHMNLAVKIDKALSSATKAEPTRDDMFKDIRLMIEESLFTESITKESTAEVQLLTATVHALKAEIAANPRTKGPAPKAAAFQARTASGNHHVFTVTDKDGRIICTYCFNFKKQEHCNENCARRKADTASGIVRADISKQVDVHGKPIELSDHARAKDDYTKSRHASTAAAREVSANPSPRHTATAFAGATSAAASASTNESVVNAALDTGATISTTGIRRGHMVPQRTDVTGATGVTVRSELCANRRLDLTGAHGTVLNRAADTAIYKAGLPELIGLGPFLKENKLAFVFSYDSGEPEKLRASLHQATPADSLSEPVLAVSVNSGIPIVSAAISNPAPATASGATGTVHCALRVVGKPVESADNWHTRFSGIGARTLARALEKAGPASHPRQLKVKQA